MAHGSYGKRRIKPAARRSKGLGVNKNPKSASLKNQIRSVERMLRKDLPLEVREAQVKKLEELKRQQELHSRLAAERKIFLRDRKIKFFERRKIERRIRRLEKMQRSSMDHAQSEEIVQQLSKYKEDLQYVTYFPKNKSYVPLFSGGGDSETVDRRNRLRKQIKARLSDAAKSGKDLEAETGSEDDGLLDLSEDDFFLSGSSSDEADADDEWTDKSTREKASSASGKAVSGMSSDERNQRQISARALMPPPRAHKSPNAGRGQCRFGSSSSQNPSVQNAEMYMSSNTSNSTSGHVAGESSHSKTGHGSNLSSNSDAHKPRRKRRHRKKKK